MLGFSIIKYYYLSNLISVSRKTFVFYFIFDVQKIYFFNLFNLTILTIFMNVMIFISSCIIVIDFKSRRSKT